MSVLVQGKPSILTSFVSCLEASERITPPPVYTIGRFASESSCTAFLICPGCPFTTGLYERCDFRRGDVLRDVDEHRAGSTGFREVERLLDRDGEVLDVLDEEIVLHARPRDA